MAVHAIQCYCVTIYLENQSGRHIVTLGYGHEP